MPLADLTSAPVVLQLADYDPDDLLVMQYRGTEGLCQLYRFQVEFASDLVEVTPDQIIGKKATLHVGTSDGKRWFHGIVSRLEVIGKVLNHFYYHVEIVPALWLLTHRYGSRIFQNQATADIIKTVLKDAGLADDAYKVEISSTEPREYCVQYRETDYNFIARLLEEEGVRWYFEQTEEDHILHIQDAAVQPQPITGEPAIPYVEPGGLEPAGESIWRFRKSTSVRPGAVVLNDFNFENPSLELRGKDDCGRDPALVFEDAPGEFLTQEEGNQVAKIRAEAFEASRQTAVGLTDSYRLAPGFKFTLADHPVSTLNGEYVVTTITHQGRPTGGQARDGSGAVARPDAWSAQADPTVNREKTDWVHHAGQPLRDAPSIAHALGAQPTGQLSLPSLVNDDETPWGNMPNASVYECLFESIPSAVTYRPQRITPWPVMRGTQTARVVGPDKEEIYCDDYGRVKVQFNWDSRGNEAGEPKRFGADSSCWIRVCQGMAGGQYGMMFLPRVGQEVVVDFLEGDPDCPIIIGRVYNKDHMPPYKLPDEKTKSVIKTRSSREGGGTNEIRFEDLKDSEQLLIHAQKDHHVRVGGEERHFVQDNRFLLIKKGEDRKDVGGHRSCKVGGKDALEVKESRSVVVKGDVFEDFKANHDQAVSGEYHVSADKIIFEAKNGISLKVGGNFVVISSAGVMIKGTTILLNSGGAALPSTIAAQVASPAAPEEPDTVEHGQDTSYTGQVSEPPPMESEPVEGQWVSIDLKDQDGNPMSGEPYEITLPSGKVKTGTLDVNGFAKVFVPETGDCKITFPERDGDDWDRG